MSHYAQIQEANGPILLLSNICVREDRCRV